MTEDIEIWDVASEVEFGECKALVEGLGVAFDPKSEFPSSPYIQLIRPGIVQVPGWMPEKRQWFGQPEISVWEGRLLTVTVPPAKALIASKLVRGSDQDFGDCLWLATSQAVASEEIEKAISALPQVQRQVAVDNYEMLHLQMKKPSMKM